LGAVDPIDIHIITFDLDKEDPQLPLLVAFQIPIKIWNITVHRCIIDKGESMCIMSKSVRQQLGSPDLIPSTITLQAYDVHPSQPKGLYKIIQVELGGKTILINTQLDYNIIFG